MIRQISFSPFSYYWTTDAPPPANHNVCVGCSECQARVPSCTSWSFNPDASIKNNTLHGCYIKNATNPKLTRFAVRISGYPANVPPPAPPPPPPPACEPNCPLYGCLPPNNHLPWCDSSLPVSKRAALMMAMPSVTGSTIHTYTYTHMHTYRRFPICDQSGRCLCLVTEEYSGEAIAESMFGGFAPSGKLPYTVYPDAWASNTPMEDMALTAGDGRTYKWYVTNSPHPLRFLLTREH